MIKLFLAKLFTVLVGFGPSVEYGNYVMTHHNYGPLALLGWIACFAWLLFVHYRLVSNTDHP